MNAADKEFLAGLFQEAVRAADPKEALRPYIPTRPKGRTIVIGAGKGAAQLARAFEELWGEPIEGVVVTRYGYGEECKHIRVLEAAHPVPDKAGLEATQELFRTVSGLGEDDLVVALVCGGGSALLAAPPDGFELEDEQALNQALLASGAPIGVMNAIRKHFSAVKGGRLAEAAFPAKVVSLVVSDVPGDDPAQVASGPTVPCQVSRLDALNMIRSRRISLPVKIMGHIETEAATAPSLDDPAFARNEVHVIASAAKSLNAAARLAEEQGIKAVILSDAIEGEAKDVGLVHAALARQIASEDQPFKAPVLLLSGGETTVTLSGEFGRGGRNTAFLLSFLNAIEGTERVFALSADTDGIDGSEDNAGAFADGNSAAAMRAAGIDPVEALGANDAWGAFNAVNDLFVPGPTGTNVNDFRAIWIKAS